MKIQTGKDFQEASDLKVVQCILGKYVQVILPNLHWTDRPRMQTAYLLNQSYMVKMCHTVRTYYTYYFLRHSAVNRFHVEYRMSYFLLCFFDVFGKKWGINYYFLFLLDIWFSITGLVWLIWKLENLNLQIRVFKIKYPNLLIIFNISFSQTYLKRKPIRYETPCAL